MLDNVAGYAVDRAKFWVELDTTELIAMGNQFRTVFGDAVGPQGGKVYSIQSVKQGSAPHLYWYAFDVWGDVSARIDELDFETWYPYLDRLDLKVGMPMTEAGRDNYRDYLKEKLNGTRSIRLMDSPHRQKRGNRDAGGHTLALGSHKSDYRVHWTLRGEEEGYQEFQLEGTRLQSAKSYQELVATRNPDYAHHRGWEHMCRSILTSAQIELSDLDGLYDSDRAAILAGREDVHGIMERKLEFIENYIGRLPKDALFSLYDALQEKLFGLPPESDGTTEQEYTVDTHQEEE